MRRFSFIVVPLVLAVAGCNHTIPPEALQLQPEALALKQQQTRRFDGVAEADLLAACAGVIQDMGFTLDESETALGVLVGSKDRTAVKAGQVVAAVLIAGLGGGATPIDDKQKIRASVVSRPASDGGKDHYVRVTFQRIVWLTDGNISSQESIEEEEVYQEFFSRLSKSVFLEAHKI